MIISLHDTRADATWKELQLQKLFNVVQNILFINMAYAAPNGFFGMIVNGESHHNYNNKEMSQKMKKYLF